MAEQIFKVDESIELGYQAPNKESGLTIIAEIYLPNKVKDSYFPDVELQEIGASGTYRGSFTPNAQGTWQVITHKEDGDGQVVRNYSVGAHNVHSVGEAIANVDSDVAGVGAAVVDIGSDVDAIDSKLDGIDTKVSALDTPPMAF